MLKTPIPFVDLRGKTPIDLLRSFPDKAHNLVAASRKTYGLWSHIPSFALLPIADKISHRWLKKNRNPYLYEIESFSEVLGIPGLYALNLSYEWGCTTGAYATGDEVSMLRVLDWPFPALGKNLVVALQRGKVGDFYNITWPGISGVFTAMAPSRFCAALNQAPMRKHGKYRLMDWGKNRRMTKQQTALPPAHLLRMVCEQADSYETARQMLMEIPIALPAIFTLTGNKAGQGCVIERLENEAQVRELGASLHVTASNHFLTSLSDAGQGWRLAQTDSIGRYKQSCAIHGHELQADNFDWLSMPIINPRTKICMIAEAATGKLVVQGFEGVMQATDVFALIGTTNA